MPEMLANEEIRCTKTDDQFNAELSAQMVKRTDKLNDATIELALRLKQAREFMAWSSSHLRGSWIDWQKEADKALVDVTQLRMAFDRESKAVIASAKDIRDFFNNTEYLQAIGRFSETVSMLERFQALKASGTLDAFADFILKISCPSLPK